MELSNELRAIIAQGYDAGGEPELARQLAIGQGLISEYRAFRRDIWRE